MTNYNENIPQGSSQELPLQHDGTAEQAASQALRPTASHIPTPGSGYQGTTPMPTQPLPADGSANAAAGATEEPARSASPNWTYGGQAQTAQYGASADGQQQRAGFSSPATQAGYASGAQGAYQPYGSAYGASSSSYSYQQPVTATASHDAGASGSGGTVKRFGKTFLAGFLGAALACAIGIGGFAAFNAGGSSGGSTVLGGAGGSIEVAGDDATLAEAVSQKVLPSVVNIDVYSEQQSYGMFGMYGYSDGGSSETLSSLGSGVLISDDGYILTNDHVVEGADRLMVTLYSGNQYEATVVGQDASSDLAVIKIEADEDLTAVQIGSSADLTVGEWVMTAGSPYGLEQSVATGIVSAVNRSSVLQNEGGTAYYTNMIQTDAAINPGNSGGALVDSDGALIGINTMIQSSSGQYSGVGFAIPVDYAMGIAQQIIDGKTPTHAQLGVTTGTVDSQVARMYGLSVDSGALVTSVNDGSGAAAAGLQQGDVITKVNNTAIESSSDLVLAIRSVNPGDTVQIEYVRDGQTQTASATLGSDEGSQTSGSSQNSGNNGYGYGYGNGGNGYGFGFGY